ncbi:uncharacterized protein PpBr36_06110 [Pyricularia pennisetigena]|uniref:uncharacterized protein n=1 Tax=Pyricularia pennisetigena TaxID=1578925 RepID=UPI0011525F0C|nr:uncharacterized protein PpBr36_06110 [Pyricularia pennisetigena]TLS23711.1 hypothetical protein PpBr36_06110 [Pyricularia pennisetigena]
MSTQYEVEHNIKPTEAPRRRRQPDMSTFTAHIHQIRPDEGATSSHNNPHAMPTPNDLSTSFRLVQDQLGTLASSAPSSDNLEFLRGLMELLDVDIANPPYEEEGVTQQFLDGLDRVPRKQLKKTDCCAICAEPHLDDPYCLVVELPCHASHRFDLECVSPWLLTKGTCPLCRKNLVKKKAPEPKDEEEGEEYDDFYG